MQIIWSRNVLESLHALFLYLRYVDSEMIVRSLFQLLEGNCMKKRCGFTKRMVAILLLCMLEVGTIPRAALA